MSEKRVSGGVVLLAVALAIGALGGGIYYLVKTNPPGSQSAP